MLPVANLPLRPMPISSAHPDKRFAAAGLRRNFRLSAGSVNAAVRLVLIAVSLAAALYWLMLVR